MEKANPPPVKGEGCVQDLLLAKHLHNRDGDNEDDNADDERLNTAKEARDIRHNAANGRINGGEGAHVVEAKERGLVPTLCRGF